MPELPPNIVDFLAARAARAGQGAARELPTGPASVVPGPGSNPPIGSDPWFHLPLDQIRPDQLPQGQARLDPMAAMTGASGAPQAGAKFIWAKGPNGNPVRIDGPFSNDLEAQKALNEMRAASDGSIDLFVR